MVHQSLWTLKSRLRVSNFYIYVSLDEKNEKPKSTNNDRGVKFTAFIGDKGKKKSGEAEETKYPAMSMGKNHSYGSKSTPTKYIQKPACAAPKEAFNKAEWSNSEKAAQASSLNMQKSYSTTAGNNQNAYQYATQQPAAYNSNQMLNGGNMMNPQMMTDEMKNYMYERSLYESLSQEIEKETNQMTTMVNMIQRYRYDVKRQIELIAYQTFCDSHKNVQASIYGSVATELALPESDMDIVVTGINSFGSKTNHQSNITLLFENITESFEEHIMPKAQKILHTHVPIIKLKFNLSQYYDTFSKNGHTALPYVNFESIDSINPHLKELSVDISICDSFNSTDHAGIKQSLFVKQKIAQYPELKPVCLILKKLLVKNGLNDVYTGGLGSFSLFLMLYSALYLERTNGVQGFQCETTYVARLFAWFLSYYGEYFSIENDMIMFFDGDLPLIYKKQLFGIDKDQSKDTLYVYDPHNSKNNTTQKTFNIHQILKWFSDTKNKITTEYSRIYKGEVPYKQDLLSKII